MLYRCSCFGSFRKSLYFEPPRRRSTKWSVDSIANGSQGIQAVGTAQTKHQVECRLLLDVIIGKRLAIFEWFAGKMQTLLIWRNSFLICDFRFDFIDRITGLDAERE